ncbi:hypothetical protein NKH18_14465 [Streptomyces sp. M10(2022)]
MDPERAELLRSTKRADRWMTGSVPNFLRRSNGAGWPWPGTPATPATRSPPPGSPTDCAGPNSSPRPSGGPLRERAAARRARPLRPRPRRAGHWPLPLHPRPRDDRGPHA